jgi:hypothetical protein
VDPFVVLNWTRSRDLPKPRHGSKMTLPSGSPNTRVRFASVKAIAESKLVHPLHQTGLDEAAASKSVDQDPETIEGLKNEQLYRDAFTMAMDAGKIDAVIFPTGRSSRQSMETATHSWLSSPNQGATLAPLPWAVH